MSRLTPFKLRFYRYKLLMLQRHPATPERIAMAVACGTFGSFLVPIGHIPMAILLAWMTRSSKAIATLATLIHAPPIYPITWPLQYLIGSFFISAAPSWDNIHDKIESIESHTFWEKVHILAEMGFAFIAAFTLGGVLIGTFLSAILYKLTLRSVTSYRHHRELKRQEKLRAQL